MSPDVTQLNTVCRVYSLLVTPNINLYVCNLKGNLCKGLLGSFIILRRTNNNNDNFEGIFLKPKFCVSSEPSNWFVSHCEEAIWRNLMMCVHIPQGDQSHDVLSAVPSGHLCSPAGVRCLLGCHCFVSF